MRERYIQTDRKKKRGAYRQTERHREIHTNREKHTEIERQTDRQRNKKKEIGHYTYT